MEGNEASASTSKPKLWENWNTRTQSTVQYVGYENHKEVKAEDDDDEDMDQTPNTERSSLKSRLAPSLQSSYMEDDEEMHRLIEQEEEMIKESGKEVEGSRRQSVRASTNIDSFFRAKENTNQFCVFQSKNNTSLRDMM